MSSNVDVPPPPPPPGSLQPIMAQFQLVTRTCWQLLLQDAQLLKGIRQLQGHFFQQAGDLWQELAVGLNAGEHTQPATRGCSSWPACTRLGSAGMACAHSNFVHVRPAVLEGEGPSLDQYISSTGGRPQLTAPLAQALFDGALASSSCAGNPGAAELQLQVRACTA